MHWQIRHDIREAYREFTPQLKQGIRLSPYGLGVDFISLMSPIEYSVWCDIRCLGLPLYPEYPVGPYFVDFGDPKRKIAVEVDSFAWHRDVEKDIQREDHIQNIGWSVFRIKSWMIFKTLEDFEGKDGTVNEESYFKESSEGILKAIYRSFYL